MTWQNMSSSENQVQVLNIDSMSLAELTPKLIDADKLVITCFNYRMCKVMQYIREMLRLNLPFIIHTHNLSTIGFWPYRYFTSSELFYKSDVFITSCQNDKATLEMIFVSPIIHVIPFFSSFKLNTEKKVLKKPQNIVYVGRISPQKNLHNLLLAYSFLKKKLASNLPPLIFFGKEDHLGCPNMNIRNDNYLDFLTELTMTLNIENDVFFKGHIDRHLIDDFLNEKHSLVVTPSLHSDENFGMSVMQSLLAQNKTVISDWGGHSDFKLYFSDLVDLMPITLSEFGPSLSADKIALYIQKNLEPPEINLSHRIDSYFQKAYYLNEQKNAISHNFIPLPLRFTNLANQIYEAKLDFSTSSTQIFSGFNDHLFLEISKFYIGNLLQNDFSLEIRKYHSVPWMKYHSRGEFEINDPQKGVLVIPNDQGLEKNYTIYLGQDTVSVTKETCERLYKNAFINPI